MPLKEFWYGDMRLLEAYQKAYYREQSYGAWLYGQANFNAFSMAMANAFGKPGTKHYEYPKWVDPMEKYEKRQETALTDEEFRQLQAEQNAWLFHK